MFNRFKQLRNIIVLSCLVALPTAAFAAAGQVEVTVDKLNVRSGPSLNDSVISTVPAKAILPVIAEQNDWVQVKLPNGSSGWLANWLVKPVASPAAQKLIESQVTNLNVRSGPSLTFPIVYTINPGSKYKLLQKSAQWMEIQLPNNQKGWVADWLVKEVTGAASAPSSPSSAVPSTSSPAAVAKPAGQTSPQGSQGNMLTLTDAPYVYPEPDDSLPAIGQLTMGQTVEKIGQQADGWYQINYQGINAWIRNSTQPTDISPEEGTVNTPAPSSGTDAGSTPASTATVTGDSVNLRSQATTNSQVITTLSQGTSLTVISHSGDWYQVKTAIGQTGWVAGWLVDVNNAGPEQAVVDDPSVSILNPDTNVRSGPGTTYDIVGRVQPGESYHVLKQEQQWFQVQLKDGSSGYIAGWLVSANGLPNVVKGNELKDKVIVVDPGHGGEDVGATGSSFSTLEKTINLQIALLLRNKLAAAGAKVVMTRTDDRKPSLQDRVDIAVHNHADIFVSIHHNTHPNTLTNGTIVFYYTQGNSSKLASLVQNELVKATHYKDLQSRFGNYFVLRENPQVSILAEVGFLSNYNEEIRLRSSKQQDLAAEGIYKGILQYFASTASE